MINQDDLLIKVNCVMGSNYKNKSFLETIHDLVEKVEKLEQEHITLLQSIEEDDAMIQQLQDEIKLYKLQETMILERAKKAERNSRFHKYMELEQLNLKLAQELTELKARAVDVFV